MNTMTVKEAFDILRSQNDGVSTQVEILRAHATLWLTGRDPEHAIYINEAADTIERLQSALLGIAHMDVYTRDGEEPAHEVMRKAALAALNTTDVEINR